MIDIRQLMKFTDQSNERHVTSPLQALEVIRLQYEALTLEFAKQVERSDRQKKEKKKDRAKKGHENEKGGGESGDGGGNGGGPVKKPGGIFYFIFFLGGGKGT